MRVRVVLLVAFLLSVSFGAFAQQANSLETLKESLAKQEQVLLTQYGKALDAMMAALKQKGDIDTYLVVETEKKRFDTEMTVPSPADAKEAFRPAVESHYKTTAELLRKYVAALDTLIKQEMKADRIDTAKAAKEEETRAEFLLADAEAQLPKADSDDVGTKVPKAEGRKPIPKDAKSFGIHHYLVVRERKTWQEARASCEEMGGHLVTIADRQENDFVKKLTGGETVWIGLTSEKVEGTFVWVDGKPLKFTDWGREQPFRLKGANYAAVSTVWSTTIGSETVPGFVCEWDR